MVRMWIKTSPFFVKADVKDSSFGPIWSFCQTLSDMTHDLLGGKFWWWRHYIKFLFDPRWIGDRSEFLAMGEPPMEKTPRKIGRNIGYDSIQRITNDISVFLVGVFIRNTYIWWFTLWMTFSMFFFRVAGKFWWSEFTLAENSKTLLRGLHQEKSLPRQ